VGRWRRLTPSSNGDKPLDPSLTLHSLLSNDDRIVKAQVSNAVRQLLHNPPDGLVTPDATLGDLCEWATVREASVSEETQPERIDFRALRTATVRLRPIEDRDVPSLYAAAVDPRWGHRWRYRGSTPSRTDFVAKLYQSVLCQYIVERLTDGEGVGFVSCYNARVDAGWAYIAFMRIAPSRQSLASEMMEGGLLFVHYLFQHWPFRKLYAEVPGWNWDQFAAGSGAFFEVEGVLGAHDYYAGRYWDQRIVALYRDKWEQVVSPQLQALFGGELG
jgi:RimJ/RimL family protein N-acetyltransferase